MVSSREPLENITVTACQINRRIILRQTFVMPLFLHLFNENVLPFIFERNGRMDLKYK